jgi:small subunit ribosomal protein S20
LANIKSAIKRAQLTRDQNLRNRMDRSELKTVLRRFEESLRGNDKSAIDAAYTLAVKTVDQAAGKGIIHKNNAARKKAQMAKKLGTVA